MIFIISINLIVEIIDNLCIIVLCTKLELISQLLKVDIFIFFSSNLLAFKFVVFWQLTQKLIDNWYFGIMNLFEITLAIITMDQCILALIYALLTDLA